MRQHGPFRLLKKVSNREIRRRATEAISVGTTALHLLLTVLAQKGGEIVVTQGTIDQCASKLNELDFEIVDGEKRGEFIIRMLEGVKGAGTRIDASNFKDAGNSIQMPPSEEPHNKLVVAVIPDEGEYRSTDETFQYMGDPAGPEDFGGDEFAPEENPLGLLDAILDAHAIARMEGGE